MFLKITGKSLLNRKSTALLTLLSIAISIFVLLGVEHLRQEAKSSFSKTVSGVDLIVGPRTGATNLLLYSVFRVGHATHNLSWDSYQDIIRDKRVAWSIPIALGDSHHGYSVMGTTHDYFNHFKFGQQQELTFAQGQAFQGTFQAVIGAEVASKLQYQVGDYIVLSHGSGEYSFVEHDKNPFLISGILYPTGTTADQTVIVSLDGLEAIHQNWQGHDVKYQAQPKAPHKAHKEHDGHDAHKAHKEHDGHDSHQGHHHLEPNQITAFMLGLNNKVDTFNLQRQINQYSKEAVMAILPGVALTKLWGMMSSIEQTLVVISSLVLLSALLGMSTMLLASLSARHHELSLMRAIGAGPLFILCLIQLEAFIITCAGILLGLILLCVTLMISKDMLAHQYGLFIDPYFFNHHTLLICSVVLIANSLIALIPSINAYRKSLVSGLSIQ